MQPVPFTSAERIAMRRVHSAADAVNFSSRRVTQIHSACADRGKGGAHGFQDTASRLVAPGHKPRERGGKKKNRYHSRTVPMSEYIYTTPNPAIYVQIRLFHNSTSHLSTPVNPKAMTVGCQGYAPLKTRAARSSQMQPSNNQTTKPPAQIFASVPPISRGCPSSQININIVVKNAVSVPKIMHKFPHVLNLMSS